MHSNRPKECLDFETLEFNTKLNNQNNICVHCASLGEVNGATGLIKEIEKNHSLFISTNTLSGMKRIKELFPKLDVVYFPLDL